MIKQSIKNQGKEQNKKAERESWVVKEIKEYGIHDPYDDSLYMSVIKKILSASGGNKKKLKILDLGCGSSAYGIRFSKLGHDVTGVDISPEAVESARKRAQMEKVDAKFLTQDIEHLKFKNSSFDMCFFGGVLHHFPSLDKVMSESLRVLKNGGVIVCVEPNRQNPHVFLSMEPKSPFRYKHLTSNERSIHYKEVLSKLKSNLTGYEVFYELMTLSSKGRHQSKSVLDSKIFYSLGGFAWKHVKGGVFRRISAIIVYDIVHLFQKVSRKKRSGNFAIVIAKVKK